MRLKGDPTIFGNLAAPKEVQDALIDSVKSMKFNGYLPSNGHPAAREAVARYSSTENDHITTNVSLDHVK
jgi:tyrosine aminotransferase